MNKKNIIPQQAQPINRITSGQLPNELAELKEEILSDSLNDSGVIPARGGCSACPPPFFGMCSFDEDEAE